MAGDGEQLGNPDEQLSETIWYKTADGRWHELRVTNATRRGIEAIRMAYWRSYKRWEARHVAFTDLKGRKQPNESEKPQGFNAETASDEMAARLAKRREHDNSGSHWEGPKYSTGSIIGMTPIWTGEPRRFEFCKGRKLDPGEYCLDCHRHGQDALIPRITAAERVGLRKPEKASAASGDGSDVGKPSKGKTKRLAGGTGTTDKRRRKASA